MTSLNIVVVMLAKEAPRLLAFKVGERFQLGLADDLVGIAVGRSANDFYLAAARLRSNKVRPRS